MKTPLELGREAYHRGVHAPAQDGAMMELIKNYDPGHAVKMLHEWVRGHNTALADEMLAEIEQGEI